MAWLFWVIAFVVLVIVEVATPSTFFFLSLAAGALTAAAVAYFSASSIWVETIAFVVVSVISIYTIRPLFKSYLKKAETADSNVDSLIGAEAAVTQTISPPKDGFVKVFSEIWLASSDEEIKTGEKVKVISVSGTKLFVKK
jgi:membrane protein implicated in regulation of membrane protease activity